MRTNVDTGLGLTHTRQGATTLFKLPAFPFPNYVTSPRYPFTDDYDLM